MRRLRSRRNRKAKPNSDSAPTGTPTPAPTATFFWDECAGTDDGATVARVGVNIDRLKIVGSEGIEDVGDDTKLGEVAVCGEEEVTWVDDVGSVGLATASAFAKTPKSGVKSVVSQHPASTAPGPCSCAPQHQ